jgi:DNA-binding NtrC family response regulator
MIETSKRLTVMILDDEEDILTLYSHYLSRKGYRVIKTYANADTLLNDIDIERRPDVYIIDYRLPTNRNGIEVASEILKKFPTSRIMFISAFELLDHELSKHDIFSDKNIEVLIKPVKLRQIEDSLLNLVRNETS